MKKGQEGDVWAVTSPGHWMLAEMVGKSEVETKL